MTSMQRTIASLVALGFLTASGCLTGRPPGVSRIRGSSGERYSIGRVSTLRLENPDGKVVVVVLYPRPVDESWHPVFGHSGNRDDVTHWEELYKVRLNGDSEPEILTVRWEYSTRTQKLRTGDASCDLPAGKVAVITFDENFEPSCNVREDLPEAIEIEKQLRDREVEESQPTRPFP